MVNRESLPLIAALLIPFILIFIIALYYYGYDLTQYFKKIPILYLIVIFPIVLGFIVIIVKYRRTD